VSETERRIMVRVKAIKLFENSANAVRAVVDVSIQGFTVSGSGKLAGTIDINGLRIIENGKGPWVSFPAKQGQRSWFDIVTIRGQLLKSVCDAVLERYADEQKCAPQERA
jgi:DNA-binding cell septation regulator SpoVG